MITGKAEVRWSVRRWGHGSAAEPHSSTFDDEAAASEDYGMACNDRFIARAQMVMVVEIVASTHFKTARR